MYRARIEKVAQHLAIEHKLCFGLSVFGAPDGFQNWLVGTPPELEKAGVPAAVIRNSDGFTFADWFQTTKGAGEPSETHRIAWGHADDPWRWQAFYTGRSRDLPEGA